MKMTFKMSDEFQLPVKKTPGGVMPYLKDRNGEVIFVGDEAHIRATALAINAYDDNQERIAELEEIAFKLQEFIVETYNQYNTDRNLGIKISLRGGELITESEAILGESNND